MRRKVDQKDFWRFLRRLLVKLPADSMLLSSQNASRFRLTLQSLKIDSEASYGPARHYEIQIPLSPVDVISQVITASRQRTPGVQYHLNYNASRPRPNSSHAYSMH